MPTHKSDGGVVSRVFQAVVSWLGEGGRTFVRLAIAALLPLLIFGILAGLLAAERTSRASTRSLAVQLATRSAERISLELNAQIDLSEALAASTALDRGDFDAFRTEAGRLTTLHPLWQGIEVTDAAGKPLFSTSGPAEARLGAASDRTSFQEVLKTDRPSVGGLGPAGLGPPAATLRVPVLRGGVLRYILSLAVVPDAIGAILDTAGAPPGWLGVVVDANGHILARTGDPNEKPGELASLGLLDAIAPGRMGFHGGITRGGLRVETVTRSLPRTGGWMVAFGVPVTVLQHPVRHALLVLAAIGCGSLALAAGLASLRRAICIGAVPPNATRRPRRCVPAKHARQWLWRQPSSARGAGMSLPIVLKGQRAAAPCSICRRHPMELSAGQMFWQRSPPQTAQRWMQPSPTRSRGAPCRQNSGFGRQVAIYVGYTSAAALPSWALTAYEACKA